MKSDWKLRFLPFLYRECPMGNAHWLGNHICYCCEGKSRNWTYVWNREKGWIPHDFVLGDANKSSSLSLSGQLSTSELLWNGVRTGLLIAVIVVVIFAFVFKSMIESGKSYQNNVQSKHEHVQENME